jgi:hypothetical protein
VKSGVSDKELQDARTIYDTGRVGWDRVRPVFEQAAIDPRDRPFVAEKGLQDLFDQACPTLLLILGLMTTENAEPSPVREADDSRYQAAKNAAAHRKPKKPSKRHR